MENDWVTKQLEILAEEDWASRNVLQQKEVWLWLVMLGVSVVAALYDSYIAAAILFYSSTTGMASWNGSRRERKRILDLLGVDRSM